MRPVRRRLAALLSACLTLSPVLASAAEAVRAVDALPRGVPLSPIFVPVAPDLSITGPVADSLSSPLTAAPSAIPALPTALPSKAAVAVPKPAAVSKAEAAAQPPAQPTARAAAQAGGELARLPAAAQPTAWSRFWSGARPTAETGEAVDLSAGAAAPAPSRLAALMPAAAAVPLAPHFVPHWLAGTWHALAPYGTAAGVIGATYAAHRVVRGLINRGAKRGGWNPNTTDTVRFLATMATWGIGAAVGMKLAGMATTTLLTTFGVAMTLAVKTTVSNLMQAVVFLLNRPFVIGEKIRVDNRLFIVEDMQLQYVKMRALAQLVADKPDKTPAGFLLKPLAEVDPLGREIDDKGFRWALVRTNAPGPTPAEAGPTATAYTLFTYSQLAGKALTLYRAYDRAHASGLSPQAHLELMKAGLRRPPKLPVRKFYEALKAAPRGQLLRAAAWMLGAVALVPTVPLVQAHVGIHLLNIAFQWLHAGAIFLATKYAARFMDAFVPILARKLGWSQQSTVVAKLLTQVVVYFMGLSSGLRAGGLEWQSMMTSFGVTAAAVTFASSDVLGNLAEALLLRFNRPFDVGATVRVGDAVGVVQEMNMFYVVLKVADKSHTLVPYSVIDGNDLGTFDTNNEGDPQAK